MTTFYCSLTTPLQLDNTTITINNNNTNTNTNTNTIITNTLLNEALKNIKITKITTPFTAGSSSSLSTSTLTSKKQQRFECIIKNSDDPKSYEYLIQCIKHCLHISHPALYFIDDDEDECRISTYAQLMDAYQIWGNELSIEINLDDKYILEMDVPSPTLNALDSPSFSSQSPFSLSSSVVPTSLHSNHMDADVYDDVDANVSHHDDGGDVEQHEKEEEEVDGNISSDDELYSEARALSDDHHHVDVCIEDKQNKNSEHENANENQEMNVEALNQVEFASDFTMNNQLLHSPYESFVQCEQSDAKFDMDLPLYPSIDLQELKQEIEPGNHVNENEMKNDISIDAAEAEAEAPRHQSFHSISISSYLVSFFNHPEIRQVIDDNPQLVCDALASDESLFTVLQQLNQLCPTAANHPYTQMMYAIRQIHVGTTCIHCNQSPICGSRYHCLECTSEINPIDSQALYDPVDVCESCFAAGKHSDLHTLTRFDFPTFAALSNSDAHSANLDKKEKFGDRVAVAGRKLLAEMKEFRMKVGMKVDPVVQDIVSEMKTIINDISKSFDSLFTSKRNRKSNEGVCEDVDMEKKEEHNDAVELRDFLADAPVVEASSNNVVVNANEVAIAAEASAPVVVVVDEDDEDRLHNCPLNYQYGDELELIRAMGFICSAADEQTVIELLNSSKGNVDQTVQWMTDCIGYGK
jgi:hypothetical protein